MTSDAKIGLLLGLFFIFIIAFIINGLPGFSRDTNGNELTANMVNNKLGLATEERRISRVVINRTGQVEKAAFVELKHPSAEADDIRFTMALPKTTSIAKQTVEPKPVAVEKKKASVLRPRKQIWPKIYVVRQGDNLAVIAKKCYGPERGNRNVNVTRLFKANRKLLNSPDDIYVGQKLVIPPLSALQRDKNRDPAGLPTAMFKKVASLRKKIFSAGKRSRWYVVREGDSLWQIAARQIGNGSRYTEIVRFNADILADEDNLVIGMRLKMPVR